MGGWNEGSTTYSEVAGDETKRATLVADVISFLDENQFDGFDLDWEYPGQRDGDEWNDPVSNKFSRSFNFHYLRIILAKLYSTTG